MSLEFFSGAEANEPMSAASLEQLREKMRKAAEQIKAIKREEKRHKKTEDELIKILLKFIQDSHKTALTAAIARALATNIPANFVLALALLGNEEIQEQAGLMLAPPAGEEHLVENTQALVFYTAHDQAMPLRMRISIDNWLKNLLYQAGERPQKLLDNAYKIYSSFEVGHSAKNEIKAEILDLFTAVLSDYLAQSGASEPAEKLQEFALYILTGILAKTKEALENRAALGERNE